MDGIFQWHLGDELLCWKIIEHSASIHHTPSHSHPHTLPPGSRLRDSWLASDSEHTTVRSRQSRSSPGGGGGGGVWPRSPNQTFPAGSSASDSLRMLIGPFFKEIHIVLLDEDGG